MPLTGELEQLPIVDVIQLIHSTRKTGTLNVFSRKGEGQLVFRDGFINSATHSSDNMKLGKILVENQIIRQEDLDRALISQKLAGENRKPLIATLHDHCGLSKDTAYKALETLIEITVVEMVSWNHGVFTLDTDTFSIPDDFKYLPTQLQELALDTQMVLMDALRIFDEKVHSGEIKIDKDLTEDDAVSSQSEDIANPQQSEVVVSEDILGLADLDNIERKKPQTFQVLDAFDPTDIHRTVIERALPEATAEYREKIVDFLASAYLPQTEDDLYKSTHSNRDQAIILFIPDEFLQHAIMTVCKREGILTFATGEEDELESLIERAVKRLLEPIVVFSCPGTVYSPSMIMELRSQIMLKFPDISLLQLVEPGNWEFSLQALNDGMRAVFPYPDPRAAEHALADDMIIFLNTFNTYIRSCFNEERRIQFAKLRNNLANLRLLKKAPDISLLLLQFVSDFFDRSLTFIVDKETLIIERSIGLITDRDNGPAAPLKTRLPIREGSIFHHVISSGNSFFGPSEDDTLNEYLYTEFSPPEDKFILLLPLKSNDRIITLTYADFGQNKARQISLDFLEFFAGQAGISMENVLFRKQFQSSAKTDVIQ